MKQEGKNLSKRNDDGKHGGAKRKFGKRHRGMGRHERSKKVKTQTPTASNDSSKRQTKLRKIVDPETAKYFTEISKLFESNEVDLEERSAVCGNALEETRGKEVELATDMIISRTLQVLLEGCHLEQLCGFLQNCAADFSTIATDKFGSHVVETALKSLPMHLQDDGSISMVEDTLTKICQFVVRESATVMCCRYGSHVLRSLLCLCKGVPADALEEFHITKTSAILAGRLNVAPEPSRHSTECSQHSFPDIFSFLVREMFNHAKDEIATIRVNKYSSFVLQTALKLLVGDDEELLHSILIILGCDRKSMEQGKFTEGGARQNIIDLLEDTAFSHLFEVIIEVTPVALYDQLLNEVFKGSLFKVSSLQCGNFVVQALISSVKTRDHLKLIWEELGLKLRKLIEIGKPGVVASILASCQRLQVYIHEACQTLATAVGSESESTKNCVPHLLFLESYSSQKSAWAWPVGDKMHTLGCLMLQTIFRCSKQFIQPYITSITSMDADYIFETAKDPGGSRVLESFLCSEASVKQKFEVITKLRCHFGELAMHRSRSFTVEKCFTASNVSLKEAIASELAAIQAELSKTRHGPYLLKKLDIDGFLRNPEQWKRSQASKENIYKEFQAAFGSNTQLQEQLEPSHGLEKRKRKQEKPTDQYLDVSLSSLASEFPGLEVSMTKLGVINDKQGPKDDRPANVKTGKDFVKNKFLRNSKKAAPFVRDSGKRRSRTDELADLASKRTLSSGDVQKLFETGDPNGKKQFGTEKNPFFKKQRL